jgi:hypothetical protein
MKQARRYVRRRTFHPQFSNVVRWWQAPAGSGAELLNRLDVSKYYVIRTIIILDASVEGY